MRNYRQLACNIVRVWMRDVLAEKGWSANEWALAASTSPTNITRMLSGASASPPSAETLLKLSRIAGSQPNFLSLGEADAPPVKPHINFCPACGFDLHEVDKSFAHTLKKPASAGK